MARNSTKSFFVALAAAAAACGCHGPSDADSSELRIDSGWFVGDGGSGDAAVSAVYQIAMPTGGGSEGLCTGTAVSDNTLVAAGHCIVNISEGGSRMQQVCLTKGDQHPTSTCSTTLLTPESWETSGDFRQDVSVVIFPHGTFQHFIPMGTQAPKVGDDVVLVGFSDANLEVEGKGMKRWGRNKVAELDSDDAIISNYGGDGNSVAVSPGDSGGPLLSACRLIGVASREDENSSKSSLHTNLTDPANQKWLLSLRAQGAEFCGLPGASATACPSSGLAAERPGHPDLSGGQPLFPCVDAGGSINGTSAASIYLALDANDGFHVSAPNTATSVQICQGKNAATCASPVKGTTPEKMLGERLIFAVAMPVMAAGSDNFFVVSAYDSTGAVLGQSAVEIR